MPGPFYFAWVDPEETVFDPDTHARVDERTYAFRLSHIEGEFPSLEIEVKNPRVGLLSAGRPRWMWFSWDSGSEIVPLFFGRLVGIPDSIQNNLVNLSFVARPADYAAQKSALAHIMKVAPYYDPVFFSPEARANPDVVLEARPALWHIDRVTHTVTASHIITGEDGTINFNDNFYDGLTVSYSQTPLRTVRVEATFAWNQEASGRIDITAELIRAFRAANSGTAFLIETFTGQGLEQSWPQEGRRIGAGWTMGPTTIRAVAFGTPTEYLPVYSWSPDRPPSDVTGGLALPFAERVDYNWTRPTVFIPKWQLATTMAVDYEVVRSRTDAVSFSVSADIQPIITEPGEEEIETLTFRAADLNEPIPLEGEEESESESGPAVEIPIGSPLRRAYITTTRGQRSLEYLISAARAHLLARARIVTVEFEIPFASGVDLSCRMNGLVTDPRLPGGQAAGKIVGYDLSLTGDEGSLSCRVSLGCTVGRGDTVEASAGTPNYVTEGYVTAGYQTYTNLVVMPIAGEITYSADFQSTVPVDDGINFFNFTADKAIVSINIFGGAGLQRNVLTANLGLFESPADIMEALAAVFTEVELRLTPLSRGPYETPYTIEVSDLMVPKTIDLEAVA